MRRRVLSWGALTIGVALLSITFSACDVAEVPNRQVPADVVWGTTCARASAHLEACTGSPSTFTGSCDEAEAEVLLNTSCEMLVHGVADTKADGGFLANVACRFGLFAACPVPMCEEPVAEGILSSCAAALGSGDCAECDYYDCMDLDARCGEDGYFVGYVGAYCKRFSQVTSPRLSDAGAQWLRDVRTCLITRMDAWYTPGVTCDAIWDRGIDDHSVCYLQEGFCSLPWTDWLKILATIQPGDLPFRNLLHVGQGCLAEWFGLQ